ncbi:MAG: hypothetical protein VYB04_08730, partial [Pseudomonadota bacterium]|nr:hypothetical protein [Pseudomonadota bacterium]
RSTSTSFLMCKLKGGFITGFGRCNRCRVVDIDVCYGSCGFGQRGGSLSAHGDIGYLIGNLLGYFVIDILKVAFEALHIDRSINIRVILGDIRRQVLNNMSFNHLCDLILGLTLELVDWHKYDIILYDDVKVASLNARALLVYELAFLF